MSLKLIIGRTLLASLLCGFSAYAKEPEQIGALRIPSLFSPACEAIVYQPVAVFDAPGGISLGRLVLDHPEYAIEPQSSCSFRPRVFFQPTGQKSLLEAKTMEVGYEEPALLVLEVREYRGALWVQGALQSSRFWLPAPRASQLMTLEKELVHGLGGLPETCTSAGLCTPVSVTLQRLAQLAGEERADSCHGNAYDVTGFRVLPSGRKVYEVQLAQSLAVKYAGKLPKNTLVPVRDLSDRWTGIFSSRGC